MNADLPAGSRSTLKRVSIDLFLVLLSILYDAWAGWDVRGFLWSIWLSSLLLGLVMLSISTVSSVLGLFRHPDQHPSGMDRFTAIAVPLLFFEVGFFLLHYGGFHVGDGMFLNHLVPLIELRSVSDCLALFSTAFALYWPMALLNLFLEREKIFAAASPPRYMLPFLRVSQSTTRLYGTVLRLHFVILLLAFVQQVIPLAGFGIYAGIYLLMVVRPPEKRPRPSAWLESMKKREEARQS